MVNQAFKNAMSITTTLTACVRFVKASPSRLGPFSLIDLSLFLALIIAAALGYKYSFLLLPRADLNLAPVAGCDLHTQACPVDMPGGGRIELSITPHPIRVLKPLQVNATMTGIAVNKVEIDFSGVDMNMGYNRQVLVSDGNGHYAGETMLPVCITDRMAWRLSLIIETDRQRIAVPFVFETPGR